MVTLVDGAVGIEDRLDEGGRRPRGERGQVGADFVAFAFQAVATGAVLGERFPAQGGVAFVAGGEVLLDNLFAMRVDGAG